VVGDGPFGVLIARLAARMDLANVVIAGFFDFRLRQAKGAAPVNTANHPDPVSAMRSPLGGEAYDAVILAVSSGRAFTDGLHCLKPRGRMVVFSAITGGTPVDLFRVHIRELEIVGSCSDQDKFDEAHALLSDPALRLSELITHRFSLGEYRQALSMAEFGKDQALKVAFVF
jgi:threonine dehydrogenase-like Zn-dependent dehydrogenase